MRRDKEMIDNPVKMELEQKEKNAAFLAALAESNVRLAKLLNNYNWNSSSTDTHSSSQDFLSKALQTFSSLFSKNDIPKKIATFQNSDKSAALILTLLQDLHEYVFKSRQTSISQGDFCQAERGILQPMRQILPPSKNQKHQFQDFEEESKYLIDDTIVQFYADPRLNMTAESENKSRSQIENKYE